MRIRNKKPKLLLVVLFLMLFVASLIVQIPIKGVGLDDAIEEGNVPDAWDYPDEDNTFDNTLGTGIKVAIVDTGIDWQHPDFYRPDFSLLYDVNWNGTVFYIDFSEDGLYDLGEEGVLNISNIYKNGTEYASSDIDIDIDYGYADMNLNGKYDYGEKICYYLDINKNGQVDANDKAVPLDKCKIAVIRDYYDGKNYFYDVNLTISGFNNETDEDGHGTHIAGIIAAGWPGIRNVTGVAPNCTLLIYKVALWNNDFVSQGIYDAVKDGADVISLSYAEYFKNITLDGSGFDGGGSKVEDAIDYAWGQGVPIVVAAGNYGNKWVHTKPSVPITNTIVPFDIPSDASWGGVTYPGCYEIEFLNVWLSPNEEIGLNVTLPDPSAGPDYTIPDDVYGGPPWDGKVYIDGPFNVTRNRYNSNFKGVNKSYMKIWRTDLSPIWPSGMGIAPGTYKILNYGTNTQELHAYISSRYSDSSNAPWLMGFPGAHWQVPFADPQFTIASPATADYCITVGSYISCRDPSLTAHLRGDISEFSSQGPRVDGVNQLDLIAPGEIILSTASRNVTSPYKFGIGNFTLKRGTSMAAPYVAGVIALAMDINNSLIGQPDIVEDNLIESAYEDAFTTMYGAGYNNITGFGKVNAYQMLITSYYQAGDDDDDDDDVIPPPAISGYDLFFIISFIGLISTLLIKKRLKKQI